MMRERYSSVVGVGIRVDFSVAYGAQESRTQAAIRARERAVLFDPCGLPWRRLPNDFPPFTTVQNRFYRLVLLCHKLALWQQGHRGSRRAIVRANLMRMLVMDDLTWRSVRIGGSAGSKTVGEARRFDDEGFVV